MHFRGYGQAVDWGKTGHWKLYDVKGQKPFAVKVDSLAAYSSAQLNDDSVHWYLQFAKQWPKEKTSVWMGAFVASYELDGVIHKVEISMYGGFFYDETEKRYYQLEELVKQRWMEWLNGKMEESK